MFFTKNKKHKSSLSFSNIIFIKVIFYVILFLYLSILLFKPELSPSDEYHFLPTLQVGKPLPMYGKDFTYYNSVELGRFSPLGAQDYNAIAKFSNSPSAYFTWNAIQFVIF